MKKAKIKRVKLDIVGKRYFDITYAFITVKKAWSVTEYNANAQGLDGSHYFKHVNVLIKTDSGIKYTLPSYMLNDGTFKQEYPRK